MNRSYRTIRRRSQRRGVVLALFVISLVMIMAFMALSIDLGLMALARTQCQNASDVAAMSGARTLNGSTSNNNNYSNVSPNAITAIGTNTVLGKTLSSSAIEPEYRPLRLQHDRSAVRRPISRPFDAKLEPGAGDRIVQRCQPIAVCQGAQFQRRNDPDHQHGGASAPRHRRRRRLLRLDAALDLVQHQLFHRRFVGQQSGHARAHLGALLVQHRPT